MVGEIADELGLFNAERQALYDAYRGRSASPRPGTNTGSDVGQPDSHNDIELSNLAPDSGFPHIQWAVQQWLEDFFRWEEAPPELVDDWEGRVLYSLGVLTERITPRGTFIFLVALVLWILTAWLLTPILRWPLESPSVRLDACIRFALASILMPLMVALLPLPQQGLNQRSPAGWRRRRLLFFLKMTSGLVGFAVSATFLLALAMAWFYLGFSPWPQAMSWFLAGLPLFLTYVATRQMPKERSHMFGGVLRSHPADHLFFGVFLLFGPVLASFIYLEYSILSQPWFGFLLLLILAGWVWWRFHRQPSGNGVDQ